MGFRFCYSDDMGMFIRPIPPKHSDHQACSARRKKQEFRCCICYPHGCGMKPKQVRSRNKGE